MTDSERTDSGRAGIPFELLGAENEPIRGNLHLPVGDPGGRLPLLLVLHGFKGYKDYGFFPYLTQQLADRGFVAVRMNFSHCGIDEDPSTFGRPDLFEKDTWSRQLEDMRKVLDAVESDRLPALQRIDASRIGLLGHSRGGATALLAASGDRRIGAVASMSAPSATDYLSAEEKETIRSRGYLVSPSSRTGQDLRIGRDWLDDLEAHRDRLDLLAAVSRIGCPVLIVHGTGDRTVPVSCAEAIAAACPEKPTSLRIEGAGHTFDCPNPMKEPTPALEQALQAALSFFTRHLRADVSG